MVTLKKLLSFLHGITEASKVFNKLSDSELWSWQGQLERTRTIMTPLPWPIPSWPPFKLQWLHSNWTSAANCWLIGFIGICTFQFRQQSQLATQIPTHEASKIDTSFHAPTNQCSSLSMLLLNLTTARDMHVTTGNWSSHWTDINLQHKWSHRQTTVFARSDAAFD